MLEAVAGPDRGSGAAEPVFRARGVTKIYDMGEV